MTDNPGGKYRNYDYGYIPKDEKIPEGWVRTLRPCMGCSSSVTYIDNDKVWHCMKCGWSCSVNDTHVSASIENTADSGKENNDSEIREEKENGMALPYSDHDFEMVKKGLEQGKTVSAISASIGRGTDALNHKIKVWREEGRLPESKRGKKKLPEQKGVLTVGTIPPVDFPEFTAEYVKELQVKLKEANDRIKALEARVQDANDLAYQFEEQVLDLQTQLKSQHDYIHALEEVAAKTIPSRTVSNTQRMCDALKAAESVNMELIEISCGSFDAILKFRIAFNPETETQS